MASCYHFCLFLLTASGLLILPTSSSRPPHGALMKRRSVGEKCPPLSVPRGAGVVCRQKGVVSACERQSSEAGTEVEVTCGQYLRPEPEEKLICFENGTWSGDVKCIPDCGKTSSAVSLIVNGGTAVPGAYPWQAALYHFMDDKWEFWCGGNLVSQSLIITAAHCTWKVVPEKMTVALGKFYRDYEAKEENVQKIKVKRIEMLQSYQDVSGNYNGDLAALFLEAPVELTRMVRPVCLDWDQEHMNNQLKEGTQGVVLGWGLTETDTFADSLRSIFLPVQSDSSCIDQQQKDFRKFVTYTTFCAGYKNGTSVCNGDSGGGLSFEDKATGRWYLQGLVSVSPRRRGTAYCDPHYATVFTKVSMFTMWLHRMKAIEEAMTRGQVYLSKEPILDLNPKLNVQLQHEDERRPEVSLDSTLNLSPKRNVLLQRITDQDEDEDGPMDMNPEVDVLLRKTVASKTA